MKKTQLITRLVSFCMFLGLLMACDPDKGKEENQVNPLIVGKWKLIASTVSPPLEGDTDLFATLDDCEKDDILEFKANNTYELTEGLVKCGEDQILESGGFVLSADLKKFTIDGEDYEILELSANTLKFSFAENGEDDGVLYTVIHTMQKM
jgi:hypothetical protein